MTHATPWSVRHANAVAALIASILGWSAFAFAGVYVWAWPPIFLGVLIVAILAIAGGRRCSAGVTVVITAALICWCAIAFQLIPLPSAFVDWLSPSQAGLLSNYQLLFSPTAPRALSVEPTLTVYALVFASTLLVLFASADRLLSGPLAQRLTVSVLGIGALLAIVGIAQRASPETALYGFWEPAGGTSNAFGPFVNRNHFAGWMVMATGLGFGYLSAMIDEAPSAASWRERILWLGGSRGTRVLLAAFALGLMFVATLWSLSRSGILSLMAVVAAGILLKPTSFRRASRWRVSATIVLVLLVFGAAWRGVDALATKFSTPDSLLTRVEAWRDTWTIVRDFPVTGTGMNTYTVATLFYQRSNEGTHLAEAHNDYLQLLSDGGLMVAVPVLLTAVAAARVIQRRWRSGALVGRIPSIQRGAALGLLGIAVQEIAEFSLQKPANALLFTVLLAIAMYEPGRGRSHPATA